MKKNNSSSWTGKFTRVLYVSSLCAAFTLGALFFSCESMGSVAQIGAAVGHATGVLSSSQANAIAKTGVAWGKAFEQITPEQEYYIGRAVAANILSNYKIQTNIPAWVTYANKICNALIVNSPRPEIFNGYHVNILDSDEINAFATSGGHIFLTRGLINCTSSEDSLAAVIAHEVSHIQLQHGLKAIKNSRVTQALVVTGTSAASAAAGSYNLGEMTDIFSQSVGEIITTMVVNGYSQSQEFDADATAMSLLALAGYEPSSMIDMLKVLEKNQSAHPGGFNKTHPTPTARIANAQKTVGNYSVTDTRSYRVARFSAVK
ncbi:MAG: M48 family metalloprotease [Treponema sp.]|nr:M48 family metalloprotease [Treponema sp.]